MAAEWTDDAKDDMLDGNGHGITHVAAFDGDPEGAGVEVSDARDTITIGAAAAGVASATDQPELAIPAGETVRYLAYYNALVAGTLRAKDLIPDEVFGSAGTLTVTSADFDLNNDPA